MSKISSFPSKAKENITAKEVAHKSGESSNNSQRASNTFNQVVEAKGLKLCSYVEKNAEFKNQTLKKSAGTQKCYEQGNTPGVGNFSN